MMCESGLPGPHPPLAGDGGGDAPWLAVAEESTLEAGEVGLSLQMLSKSFGFS